MTDSHTRGLVDAQQLAHVLAVRVVLSFGIGVDE